jgi:4-amino-4-deoxy-L-arabinose transferase-like glycosyltransferase
MEAGGFGSTVVTRVSRRDLLLLAGLTAIALALRLHHLGFQSLNCCDEPFSLALSQRSFGRMFELFGYEANGAIYSIILCPLLRISESEEMIRAPAMVAGVLAVPSVWWAGRVLANDRVALIAAALIAVNPMAVYLSQFARTYSIILAVAPLAYASLALALRSGERRWWVIYAAAMTVTGYCSATTPFILLAGQAVYVYVVGRERIRPWLVSIGWFLLASLPLFVGLVIERSRRDPLFWLDRPGPGSLNLTGKMFTAGQSDNLAVYLLTIAIAVALVAWTVRAARRYDLGGEREPSYLGIPIVIWAWAVIPFVTLFAAAQLTPMFYPLYVVAVLPGLVVGLAVIIDRLGNRVRWAAVGALVALALIGTVIETTRVVTDSWRGALGWIEQNRRVGDRVLVDSISIFPVLGYYDNRYRAPNGEVIVDEWRDHPLPPDIVPLDTPGGYSHRPPGPPTPQMIADLASGDRRLFVVLANFSRRVQGDVPNGAALTWARQNCDVVEPPQVDIFVYLISGCPAQASRPT